MAQPWIVGTPSDRELSQQLLSTVWRKFTWRWWAGLVLCGAGTLLLFALIAYSVAVGVGVWGNNMPVAWAFPIINFVWWIGIGHAGTFISAILLLLEQPWRTSINRFAEAMTLFAVAQAAIFPLLHLGRPWFAYWLAPYPSTLDVWPQFKSPLPWDLVAISTYGTVSLLFWYLGLIPDLAALRDVAPGRRRRMIYGLFSLGWTGSARAWKRYKLAYGLLAGIATPLVISVHSIVSTDFAVTVLPGWHATIFPPYFVAGAILSGFAVVMLLAIPTRRLFAVDNVITIRHLDAMAKMTLLTAWIVAYTYGIEQFIAWYSGDVYEGYAINQCRLALCPNAWTSWFTIAAIGLVPQLLWFRRIRRNPWVLWCISLTITCGAWTERFVIIVLSLERDFLPSAWRAYSPTWIDIGILVGTISFFMFLFLLFIRFIPFVSAHEVQELRRKIAIHRAGAHGRTGGQDA